VTAGSLSGPILLHLFRKRIPGINGSSFYGPDALSVHQTVSINALSEGNTYSPNPITSGLDLSFFIHHHTPDGRGVWSLYVAAVSSQYQLMETAAPVIGLVAFILIN